jgi:hypothetical protein
MDDATNPQELFGQLAGKTVETLTLWADANQRVVLELASLSATAAKETARLYGELQSSAIEAMRESQAHWLKRQAETRDRPKDSTLWYHKGLAESIEGAQRVSRLVEGQTQALTRSAERISTTAEHTAKEIQETIAGLGMKLQELYAG